LTSTQSQGAQHATPSIDQLLKRLRRRLQLAVWLHGVGRLCLALGAWLLFIFLVDWGLHVPAGVRILHFAGLVTIPLVVLWRELIVRLRCIPDRVGLAVLIERAHPSLHELLVSAVQLSTGAPAPGSNPELVAGTVSAAERAALSLELTRVSDTKPARQAFLLGVAASALTATVFLWQPAAALVFFARLIGGNTPWPQRTHLAVEIPHGGSIHVSLELVSLAVARGSDVPILVRAHGKIPSDVSLHFEDAQDVHLGSAGKAVYRTLLRSVQEDISFFVTGGDDNDGTPRVEILVLQPPDVTAIAVTIEPPAYSGLETRLEFDRDVAVLAGSRITVAMQSQPVLQQGEARLLPEDRVLDLVPLEFPARSSADNPTQAAAGSGLGFELIAKKSLRYRFELRDEDGLENPNPGLFAIHVDLDRQPAIELLAPARGDVETVLGGSLPLRALVSDDFGLGRVTWSTQATSAEAMALVHELHTLPTTSSSHAASERVRATLLASALIDVNALFGADLLAEGEAFELLLVAEDNREPQAQRGQSAAVRLRVISSDEFLRRIQDRLGRVRIKADALADLLSKKRDYTRDILAGLESDELAALDASSIGTALSGARRVQGDSRALARELAAVSESMIYSRLDQRAGPMLDALFASSSTLETRSFQPAMWSELARMQAAGELGEADFADKLLKITGVALRVSEVHAENIISGLRAAQDESDLSLAYDTLLEVQAQETAAATRIEELLALLSEWDSYQSILSSTRDLLKRQKNLLDRTRQYYKDH
jgi:hypothetical protein